MDTTEVVTEPTVQPFAIVRGEAVASLPEDLYIPPDALEIFLEAFSGPLDLLLYLIKRQNLDILDIPIAEITRQYMKYIELMKELRLELAAEYLVMAAMLAEIKSRMLLPRSNEDLEDETDPRAELIRRLQEYERFQQAADSLAELPRMERDTYEVRIPRPEQNTHVLVPEVDFKELLWALKEVMQRTEWAASHEIKREPLSIRERMSIILDRLHQGGQFISFTSCFTFSEGRMGVVVTFIAILELLKQSLIKIVQTETYGHIHIASADESSDS